MSGAWGLLERERVVTVTGMVVMVLLAWVHLWQGAGMGMSALDMTTLSLFPHLQPNPGGVMDADLWVVVSMWWVMMVAMMTPSAVPLVLLYQRVLRHHAPANGASGGLSAGLLAGYLVAWLAFSVAAALLQQALGPAGLLSEMMLWSRSAGFSATVLFAAGLYQCSPLKQACLAQCRSPVGFLTRHWRPGWRGSWGLGLRHGAYCVGCCWALMALLFVGGVMNLVWIAALTLVVLVEKLSLAGARLGPWLGGMLMLWAMVTLLV